MKEAGQAIRLMNLYGKERVPFLFIIDFEMRRPLVYKLDEIGNRKLLYNFGGLKNCENKGLSGKKVILKKYPICFDEYKTAFNKVMKNIYEGNTYLLNLTFPTKIEINLSLEEIFRYSTAKYKLYYENLFVVFSPETFIKIENGKIYSYPMKGTIDAGIQNAEEKILNDEKEKAEHITIVDLIRNDLSIVAKDVTVEKFRYIDKIKTHDKTLLQVSSRIAGKMPENYEENIGDIIFELLPAGSISGAPKKKTVEIIKETEGYDRGYYTGICGIFDGKNLDSAVMIRYIEKIGEEMFFKSGGGITFMSDPQFEYQELMDKVYVPII